MTNRPDFDQALPRIAKALEDVSAQLSGLSAEVRTLAASSGARPPAEAEASEPPQPQRVNPWQPPQAAQQPQPSASQPYPQPPQAPPKPTLTQRLGEEGAGSRMLVWIGGAVTLVGVVLMMVLAIQRGWIGPVPRVLLGAVLAAALIAVSLRAHRTPAGRAGAFALAATGIAALYLDIVAATALLDLLPPWLGLLLGLLVAAAGLVLAGRWDAQTFAVFVLLGCALTAPFITDGFTVLLLGFLLVLQVASAPVQLMRGWRSVPLAAGLPPVLVAMSMAPTVTGSPEATIAAALLASLLTAGIAVLTALRRPDDDAPLLLLVTAAAPTLLLAQWVPDRLAAGAIIVLAVPLIAVWVIGRVRVDAMPKVGAAAGGVAAVCLLYANTLLLTGDARAIALLGESLLLSYAAFRLRAKGVLLAATGFATVGGIIAIAGPAHPDRVLQAPFLPPEPITLVAGAVTFALIGAAALALVLTRAYIGAWDERGRNAPQFISALTTLYGASGLTLCLALLVMPDRSGFLLGHSVVTVSWMITALVLLQRGITRREPRIAGLVLVGAALLKLVLFDLAALDGIARVAAFLGAGLVLLGAGVRYTRLVAQHAEQQANETSSA